MFPTSSQKRFWTFKTEADLTRAREIANTNFIVKHGANIPHEDGSDFFLTPAEERIILRHYETQLRDFCRHFQPTQPKCVYGTASHYFKRFYLKCSPMDFHPKEILVTCAYLACKVEEFNVSIVQFVSNIRGDREKASTIILANELLLMQVLNYHLTIHNPFRAVEGLLIDIKTRTNMNDPEKLRPYIEEFIERMYLTDVCLMFAPSQIALAAILHAASKLQENLDDYITQTLVQNSGQIMSNIIDAVRKIRTMVKTMEPLPRDGIKVLQKKLEKCRNQENNPDSLIYKQRMVEDIEEEEDPELLRILGNQETYMDGFSKIATPNA